MPKKPELFVLMGYGWSATSPLWRTLRATGFFFSGYSKEPYYPILWYYHQLRDQENIDLFRSRIDSALKFESRHSPHVKALLETYPGGAQSIRPLLLDRTPNVENYIKYYKNCHKGSGGRKLLDFTVPNIWMEEPYFSQFWKRVAEEFELKFITIVRDPIRRHYSEFSGQYFNGWEKRESGDNDLNKTMNQKDFVIERSRWGEDRNFVDNLEKCQKVAPTLMLVMEELWSDWSKLERFVEIEITEMFPNVYWPERGKSRIRHPKLQDQWCTDRLTITQEIYDALYERMEHQYIRWKERFGTLPTGWGRMVDYRNAPPIPSWNHPNEDSLYL